eukprot:Filipodium_phascolosomae@DN1126_c1_g1_i1.p2
MTSSSRSLSAAPPAATSFSSLNSDNVGSGGSGGGPLSTSINNNSSIPTSAISSTSSATSATSTSSSSSSSSVCNYTSGGGPSSLSVHLQSLCSRGGGSNGNSNGNSSNNNNGSGNISSGCGSSATAADRPIIEVSQQAPSVEYLDLIAANMIGSSNEVTKLTRARACSCGRNNPPILPLGLMRSRTKYISWMLQVFHSLQIEDKILHRCIHLLDRFFVGSGAN